MERRFGFLQATALNMTNMIGIGPFITIPVLMSAMNGPQAMLGWLVAVLITIPDAMIWAELGAALPGSGGSYLYLKEGFGKARWGRLMAFIFGTTEARLILYGLLTLGIGLVFFVLWAKALKHWPFERKETSGGAHAS